MEDYKEVKKTATVNSTYKRSLWWRSRNDKEKAYAFARHLENVFKPLPSNLAPIEENEINEYLQSPHQMDMPIKNFKLPN